MKIFPEQASSYAAEIDNLFWLTLVLVSIAFVISIFVLLYPLIRNHSDRNPKATYFTGHEKKHFKWVVTALIILAASDFSILLVEHDTWVKTQEVLPENDFHVAIIGRQWNWIFVYPGPDNKLYTTDDIIVDEQDSELHVPAGKKIKVDIKARDVLHSVFIPAFRFKYDAIPGRTITRWFQPIREGKYDISCAEICGVLHSKMRNFIVVESEEKFNEYLKKIYSDNHKIN